jgi:hypothetical protein
LADFERGVEGDGPLVGIPYYQFSATNDDKVVKLSLGQTHLRDEDEDLSRIYDDPNDPRSNFKLFEYHLENNFPQDWDSYILLRKTPEKAKKQMKSKGLKAYDANIYRLDKNSGDYIMCPANPGGKFGKNHANTVMKRFGKSCDFSVKTTSRSAKKAMATKIGTSGASVLHLLQKTRPTTPEMQALYQENTKESSAKIFMSLRTKPAPIDKHYGKPPDDDETLDNNSNKENTGHN